MSRAVGDALGDLIVRAFARSGYAILRRGGPILRHDDAYWCEQDEDTRRFFAKARIEHHWRIGA